MSPRHAAVAAASAVLLVGLAALRAPELGEHMTPAGVEQPGQLVDIALDRPCPPGPTITLDPSLAPLRVTELFAANQPTAVLVHEGYGVVVGSRDGVVVAHPAEGPARVTMLDLRGFVSAIADQGLLEIAIHGHQLFVLRTDSPGDTVLSMHTIQEDGIALREGVELLRVPQLDERHNGGGLAIAADGEIFVGIGDGGGQGDPAGSGADSATLLGSVLRGRVDDAGTLQPSDARGSLVWASGVRNPHRIWLTDDDATVWVTDVGESCREELNMLDRSVGAYDLGWNAYEGDIVFLADPTREATQPLAVYSHDSDRCAIIGGAELPLPFRADRPGTGVAQITPVVLADNCTGHVFVVDDRGITRLPLLVQSPVDVTAGPDGNILIADLNGHIWTLES